MTLSTPKGDVMIYLNKNSAITQIKELESQRVIAHTTSLKRHTKALELFQKRAFLEEIIEESIAFNKTLSWQKEQQLKLTTTAEALINVFKLRSEVYGAKGYQCEFKDAIEGLNFDTYDTHSAIFYYQSGHEVTGSIRLIFDTKHALPTEKTLSFDYLRAHKLVELSRQVVKQDGKGLGLEFKNFYKGIYELVMQNSDKVNLILAAITNDHYPLYSKFGGIKIEKELEAYGNLDKAIFVLSWNIQEISAFFTKCFLR
jgi:hypothetical protein